MKDSHKIGVLFAAAMGGYLGMMVTYANPPGGRRVLLIGRARAQEQQENQILQVPMLAPGSIFRDPNTGKEYRVGKQTLLAVTPPGYEPCRKDGTLFNRPFTVEDLKESHECRDGTPYGPNCAVGGVEFLCNPMTGFRVETLVPSQSAMKAAVEAGRLPPAPTFAPPHTGQPQHGDLGATTVLVASPVRSTEGIRRNGDRGATSMVGSR
jgi:hypothetical protein